MPNAFPVAVFTWTVNGLAVTFDAALCSDSDGCIVSYHWEFGDGDTGAGPTPTHTYHTSAPRSYSVALTVEDDDGATASVSHAINITPPAEPSPAPNANPVAVFSWSVDGLTVDFDAGLSYDAGGWIVSYQWRFGDGNTGVGVAPTHTYDTTAAATYSVTLTVEDDDGATASASHAIIVIPPLEPLPEPEPEPDIEVAITASQEEIEVLSYAIESNFWYTRLVGTAKNTSSEAFDWVSTSARIYDAEDVVIDSPADMAFDVAPGMLFEFALYIWDHDRAVRIEIHEIEGISF